jgi:hypothetical protein
MVLRFVSDKLILINGDSYTAPRGAPGGIDNQSYSDRILDKNNHNYDVLNLALPGSSNDRIFKSTIEHILRHINVRKEIICVVGYSFICERFEIAQQTAEFKGMSKKYYYNDYGFDLPYDSFTTTNDYAFYVPKFVTGSVKEGNNVFKTWSSTPELSDPTLLCATFYNDLYMFVNSLENLGVKYYIFSAAHNANQGSLNDAFLNKLNVKKEIDKNPNIDINFSIMNFAKERGLNYTNTFHLKDNNGFKTMGDYVLSKLDIK